MQTQTQTQTQQQTQQQTQIKKKKLGPNDKCFCGSELKFKKCCSNLDKFADGQEKSSENILICKDAF